jgi:hypothetical protein
VHHPIATIAAIGIFNDWYFFPVVLVIALVSLAVPRRRFFIQWLNGIRGRDWPTISANVDIVSVVSQIEETRYGERVIGYAAALTYFYRNPDLQMGEYSRMFDVETDAQAWVAPYKGCTVMVRVDPRDPSRSVLRKEDL